MTRAQVLPAKLRVWFSEWKEALESKALKVNADETETVLYAKTAESFYNH